MNNFKRIKNMTVDEMAEFIDELSNSGEYTCSYCKFYNDYLEQDDDSDLQCNHTCVEGIKQWLLEECEE